MKGNSALLIIILAALCGTLYLSYTNFQQIQLIRQENTTLWEKLDSVHHIVNKKPVKQKSAPSAQSTGSALLDYVIQVFEESDKNKAEAKAKQKVTVSSKYRMEDRYISGRITEPEYVGTEIGEVVLNVFVNYAGEVKSAKLKSSAGITDEDVIESCKKAALKTHFNCNLDMDRDQRQSGTITYIFSMK